MGKESKKERIHVYVELIHFVALQKLTAVVINYAPKKVNLKSVAIIKI